MRSYAARGAVVLIATGSRVMHTKFHINGERPCILLALFENRKRDMQACSNWILHIRTRCGVC